MMDNTLQITTQQPYLSENTENPSSEQNKFTLKQRLGRLLLRADVKNKHLRPQLKSIKNDMYENFVRTGIWESHYINRIFWLYAKNNQDIKILKPQFSLFSKHLVNVADVSETEPIRVTQYIKTLRFIRQNLAPMLQKIQTFVSEAKKVTGEELKENNPDAIYSQFEHESEKMLEHTIAKEYLMGSMVHLFDDSPVCNEQRFLHQKTIVADSIVSGNYQDFLVFAVLGFHYFNQKQTVYEIFSPEDLQTTLISFTLPGLHPTSISLGAFLKIIEHLDFKKNLFAV